MIELKENMGIPRSIVIAMAVLAGVTVANLYYNQPLLEMISSDLGISHITANLITVITQVGYAFGLFFIIRFWRFIQPQAYHFGLHDNGSRHVINHRPG